MDAFPSGTAFDAGHLLGPLMRVLPEAGMPQDRLARIAARRAFVEMKQRFMAAVEGCTGSRGEWLRHHVRLAHQPLDLWVLRGSVFEALALRGREGRGLRAELDSALDSMMSLPVPH